MKEGDIPFLRMLGAVRAERVEVGMMMAVICTIRLCGWMRRFVLSRDN